MNLPIAFCGLNCETCLIHLATHESDSCKKKTMRASIALQISKFYGLNEPADNIGDCDGCQSNTGRLFSGCMTCSIRLCAVRANVESCAFCKNYPCELLKKHFLLDPSAQTRLEKMR